VLGLIESIIGFAAATPTLGDEFHSPLHERSGEAALQDSRAVRQR
jgi:hypothetical protein